jgi:hypothetical protein
MTENNGGIVTPDSQEQPQVAPGPVSKEGNQELSPQSGEVGALKTQVEQLTSELRGLQSRQDKAENSFDKRLEALGVTLTPEQIQQNTILDLQEKVEQITQSPPAPASAQEVANPTIAKVMEELEIADPTEDMKAAALKHANNPVKMAAELAILKTQKPAPSPANVVIPGGETTPPPPSNLEDLTAELAQIKAANPNRGKWSKETRERVGQITKEMDEAFTN